MENTKGRSHNGLRKSGQEKKSIRMRYCGRYENKVGQIK